MDLPQSKHTLANNLLFLFLLFSSNLLTFFFTSYHSSPTSIFATTTACSPPNPPPPSSALPPEFLAFTSPKHLPLGHNPNFDNDSVHPPVGHPCTLFTSDLRRYMTYTVNGSCPDDERLSQRLLLKGCEPLPRRRCRPPLPSNFTSPLPLPQSLWSIPPDSSVVWTAYTCKSYSCLIDRKHQKDFSDCKDCFDLTGRERSRWVKPSSNPLDLTIDKVLNLTEPGTIRIGLDIGGGTGTFAVRMRERNVTILTTSMNLNGPFNNFMASRGVIPLYMSISQRLPFFDNTLDMIHSMHVLSNWIPTELLHFVLFDVYRVLRPGGLFWLDHFFFVEEQMGVYVGLIESVGFGKLRWVLGRKLDRGVEKKEMYITAVLEKPSRNP